MFCDGGCSTFCADISSCLGEEESSANEGQNRTRRTIVCTLYSYEKKWMLLDFQAFGFQLVCLLPPLGACGEIERRDRESSCRRAEPVAAPRGAAKVHSENEIKSEPAGPTMSPVPREVYIPSTHEVKNESDLQDSLFS